MTRQPAPPLNGFSVDAEDWIQAVFDSSASNWGTTVAAAT